MAKLTKVQLDNHREAEKLIKKPRDLTIDEIYFVLANWMPDSHAKTSGSAFFTPSYIGEFVGIHGPDDGTAVDLGAGIGCLSFFWGHHQYGKLSQLGSREPEITAVEINPDFIRVGKKVVPNAHWVEGDIYDLSLWKRLGKFDWFVSNPPFSRKRNKGKDWLVYIGEQALEAIEVGIRVTTESGGVAILPQSICPFKYNKNASYEERVPVDIAQKFFKTWPELNMTCLAFNQGNFNSSEQFQDTSITVEVVNIEWPVWDRPTPGIPMVKGRKGQHAFEVAFT